MYRHIVQPAFISVLSKLPAIHWTAHISPAWILYRRWKLVDTFEVHNAHERLGPIVRLGPNEISVNSVEGGIRTVYSGGYEKGAWYSNVFSNYGVRPMFAMPDKEPHSKRKRMLSNVYAKSTLQTSKSLKQISSTLLGDRLLPRLERVAKNGAPIESYDLFTSLVMDFVNAYVFGLKNGSDFIRNEQRCHDFLREYKARQNYTFWPQELPNFTSFVERIGFGRPLVPAFVKRANRDIEAWVLRMCNAAEQGIDDGEGKPEDYPTVYAQLRTSLLKESSKNSLDHSVSDLVTRHRLDLATECLDHVMAGMDTSGTTLTYVAWELSRNITWQTALREEVAATDNLDAKTLDTLPTLHAILMETLRLHAAIPGNQPRITPASATLGAPGHSINEIPSGVRVNAQAWSLHRNPSVFPNPEIWDPSRWLDATEEQSKEMSRWFWAFGSGGRMCVGSNLAMQEMKAIIVTIWAKFSTEVTEGGDRGMAHNGGYTAEPVGFGAKGEKEYLMLSFKEL